MKKLHFIALGALATIFCGCSSNDEPTPPPSTTAQGLFILNQGNFQFGNSTLTYYTPDNEVAEQEVFYRANDAKLGDLAQSMTIDDNNTGWVVVNNSNVIFAIDADTFKEKGRITSGIISPRFIHFVSPSKAYVTQLYDNRIAIVDPTKYEVTGYITIPGMDVSTGSTEMMVQVGKYVYVNCWSYNNTIVRIDSASDTVDGSLTTGIQPKAMTLDVNNNIWCVTDGGYEGSYYGYENPTLIKINTSTFTIDRTFELEKGANIATIVTNGAKDRIYWVCNDVYTMSINDTKLPEKPIISAEGNWLNGLTVDPQRGDIYIANALDYVQPGIVLRYCSEGNLLSTIRAGVIPGAFCWKK